MSDLIRAAEAALTQLKHHHAERSGEKGCPTPEHCPTAAAILALETEIARAKLPPAAKTEDDWVIDTAIGFLGDHGLEKVVDALREWPADEWKAAHPGKMPHRICPIAP